MSNLIKSGVPLSWGDWRDFDSEFPHSDENPVAGSWKSSGTATNAYAASNELVFAGAVDLAGIPGSWSYEFQPFTSNWGIEFDYKGTLNAGGAQNGLFYALLGGAWTTRNVGSFFFPPTSLSFRLFHQNPVSGTQDRVQLYRINENSFGDILAFANLPGGAAWWGSWHSVRIWFDNDRDIRVWIDGTLALFLTLPSDVRTSPGKRAFNFINQIQGQLGYLRNFRLYDRVYDRAWSSVFSDDFNRSNGAVGNGWTQIGSNAAIASNSWSTTGTTDGSRAIIRDSGISNGNQRVEGVVGGNIGVQGRPSSLLLCCNSAGTQALGAQFENGTVRVGRYSSSLSGNLPSYTTFQSVGHTVSTGDTVAAAVRDGVMWAEVNGEVVAFNPDAHAVVPSTNQYCGAAVQRSVFVNSHSWNDIRLLQAA